MENRRPMTTGHIVLIIYSIYSTNSSDSTVLITRQVKKRKPKEERDKAEQCDKMNTQGVVRSVYGIILKPHIDPRFSPLGPYVLDENKESLSTKKNGLQPT